MTDDSRDITVLNALISTLLDSVDGYEQSSSDTANSALAQKFDARAREREGAARRMQQIVTACGGRAEDGGSPLASVHRGFMSLRDAAGGNDDAAIVAEIERGEDYLKCRFETALGDEELSIGTREAIHDAWQAVRDGHDEMNLLCFLARER